MDTKLIVKAYEEGKRALKKETSNNNSKLRECKDRVCRTDNNRKNTTRDILRIIADTSGAMSELVASSTED